MCVCVCVCLIVDVIRHVRVMIIMICGDFNCVLDNDAHIISGEKQAEGTVVKFNTILNKCDLHGTWRLCNPNNRDYTWSKRTPFVARRLDYIFLKIQVKLTKPLIVTV